MTLRERYVIASIAQANGWYRVDGNTADSYSVERVSVFAVLNKIVDGNLVEQAVVGIPSGALGVVGVEWGDELVGIAGYVTEDQIIVDGHGDLKVSNEALEKLAWEL